MSLPIPTVTALAITPTSGTVGIGAQIALTLSADQPVTENMAGGAPAPSLSNGMTAADTGVDGSGKPRFTDTVAAGDTTTSDLTVTGLILTGGSITGGGSPNFEAGTNLATGGSPISIKLADGDGDGTPDLVTANSGNEAASTGLAFDATRPTLVSATVNGASLVLISGEVLDATIGPGPSASTVMAGGAAVGVSSVAVNASAKTVTPTRGSAGTNGQSVPVAHTDSTSGNDTNAIQGAAGSDAASLAATGVTNLTSGTEPSP